MKLYVTFAPTAIFHRKCQYKNVPFSKLKDVFSLSDKVLELFRSYLEQHFQRMSFHGILSDVQFLLSGVQ